MPACSRRPGIGGQPRGDRPFDPSITNHAVVVGIGVPKDSALTDERQRNRRILLVDFPRQSMTIEDRLSDYSRHDAVADPIQALNSCLLASRLAGFQRAK